MSGAEWHIGFLNPANPKTNLSLSFKASDFGTEWPIGNEKGNVRCL